jgi:heat shock protein HslJ
MMLNSRRRFACFFALSFAVAGAWPARAGEPFPYGSELMLDAAPMPGSKRVPMLEIEDDGTASIDLWCGSLHAQATVTDDTIAIVPGQPAGLMPGQPAGETQAPCDPDRQASDATLLTELTQVTAWRRSGDLVELSGPTTLRYRLMTN